MLQLVHIAAFLLAVGSCLLATWRVRTITHIATRRGLVGLFCLSAVWALGQAVLLANPPLSVARVTYMIALIAGLASIWAWLYFCSAYAGQPYHKETRVRRGAAVVFLAIVGLKITNPIHGEYFAIERVTAPFPHIEVELLKVHGVVTVLAYALTAIGFYLLFELFRRSEVPKRGLGGLIALTGLPVVLDVLSDLGVTQLVANTYVPLGVAAFGVGVLFVTEEAFEEVHWASHQQLLDWINEGVIIVDNCGFVRDYNATALQLFPDLDTGQPLPETAEMRHNGATESGQPEETTNIITIERGSETNYYLLTRTELAIGPDMYGQAVMVSNVTTVERQRRELKRQSEQLDDFAAAITHELRNTLTIAESNLVLLDEALDAGETADGRERVAQLQETNERMATIVDDLNTLARLSQTTTNLDTVNFETLVKDEIAAVDEPITLLVEADRQIRADRTRIQELVRNVALLASETNTSKLCVRIDGETISFEFDTKESVVIDGLLKYGEAVPHAKAGMLGPNIQTLARAQGWTVTVTGDSENFCIELNGVAGRADTPREVDEVQSDAPVGSDEGQSPNQSSSS